MGGLELGLGRRKGKGEGREVTGNCVGRLSRARACGTTCPVLCQPEVGSLVAHVPSWPKDHTTCFGATHWRVTPSTMA